MAGDRRAAAGRRPAGLRHELPEPRAPERGREPPRRRGEAHARLPQRLPRGLHPRAYDGPARASGPCGGGDARQLPSAMGRQGGAVRDDGRALALQGRKGRLRAQCAPEPQLARHRLPGVRATGLRPSGARGDGEAGRGLRRSVAPRQQRARGAARAAEQAVRRLGARLDAAAPGRDRAGHVAVRGAGQARLGATRRARGCGGTDGGGAGAAGEGGRALSRGGR
mmetsp:Transcript_28738/g.67783  ORF Transcript_28738/g.67783 Transcript_28738/m.67783 type:complete len:224 (-) Transcript_28738:556-1227(-)